MTFNDVMFEYYRAEEKFTDALVDAGWGAYDRVGGDSYDNSIEFHRCTDGERICEAAQRVIFDAGFSKCWTNHQDGSEWYYNWSGKEFRYTKGTQHKAPKAA